MIRSFLGLDQKGRESIWSVPAKLRTIYGFLFALLFFSGEITLICISPWKTQILLYGSAWVIVSAALAMIVADTIGGVMTLTEGVQRVMREIEARRLDKIRQEGAEKFQQVHAEWRAKQANGGTDEPEPTPESISYR